MIKLAAFDVDGTLRDRSFLPESTKEALRLLREKGVALAICTGRSEYELAPLREELGIDWAVTCNGAHVGHQGRTVVGNPFPAALVRGWLEHAERAGHELLLYGAEKMFLNRHDAPRFLRAREEIGFMEPAVVRPGDWDRLPHIYQAIVFCEEAEQAGYTSLSEEALYTHRWRTWAVDLNPAGMNKAVGLRRLLEHLGLKPDEAAAFGDGLNDMEMMQLVGHAVVMGNGCDELKAVATFVTKPLRDDGVAHAVRHLETTGAIR